MDYPFILLWVFGWCALRTVGFLFQAEQNADARQNQQHTDTAEQQRTETAGDRQRKARTVDDFNLFAGGPSHLRHLSCRSVQLL